MTPAEQIQILSSVINGQVTPSGLSPQPVLHDLFAEHRVSGRALAYIATNEPSWADQALISHLTAQQRANTAIIAQHAAALKTLREDWMPADERIVIIKGLALFGHTARPETIRATLDADILVTDPERLVRDMKAAGLHEYRNVSPHELINVTLSDVPLDLHAHYPVWSIDRHLGRPLLDTRHGTPVQVHASKLIVSQIPVDALLDGAVPATMFGVPGVWHPGVSMSALIACVHCFRDYLSRSSVTARSKPPLRFAEIAELADYLTLPTFDVERFSELAEQFHAQDAVEWLLGKVETYHGGHEVLDMASRIRARLGRPVDAYLPPAQAIWTGFWATLQRDPTDALLRHATTAEVVSRLGPITVPVEQGQGALSAQSDGTLAGTPRAGVLHVRSHGCLPIQVSTGIIGASLALDIALGHAANAQQLRLHLDIDDQALELHWNAGRHFWKKSKEFPDPVVHVEALDDVLQVHIDIPVAWACTDGAAALPMVLAAGEFSQGFDISRGTLLPLVLSRTSNVHSLA